MWVVLFEKNNVQKEYLAVGLILSDHVNVESESPPNTLVTVCGLLSRINWVLKRTPKGFSTDFSKDLMFD